MPRVRSPYAIVDIDLRRVAANCAEIRRRVDVAVLAVVKADAYGLGDTRIAAALTGSADEFAVFSLREAQRLRTATRKPILVLGPPGAATAADFRRIGARPSVHTIDQARRLRAARPALCIDVGMQRFACPADQIDAVFDAGDCREAFTHATSVAQARMFARLVRGRGLRLHAAASLLLDRVDARFDAVRPGFALYDGAVRVSLRLLECSDSRGPVGYTGFHSRRHGVIGVGYAHGIRPGICLVNGRRRRIREVGMQTAYVDVGADDRPGDEVILLGDGLPISDVASAWRMSSHETLLRLAGCGRRRWTS